MCIRDRYAPDPADYGVWVPGIPVLVGNGLEAVGTADWLSGLIDDGIVAGVGAVLGFVPQMLVLFLLLAFLEACGYMSRIAFVLDRVFRKFGLSGKSFIPMLIGTGCGIPGIMASRTIENERDRRMTIMTTTFIPCGAKAVSYTHLDICGTTVSGTDLRSALGLNSAYFTFSFADGKFTFDVKGKGHGVGMSQYGADYLARQGLSLIHIFIITVNPGNFFDNICFYRNIFRCTPRRHLYCKVAVSIVYTKSQ